MLTYSRQMTRNIPSKSEVRSALKKHFSGHDFEQANFLYQFEQGKELRPKVIESFGEFEKKYPNMKEIFWDTGLAAEREYKKMHTKYEAKEELQQPRPVSSGFSLRDRAAQYRDLPAHQQRRVQSGIHKQPAGLREGLRPVLSRAGLARRVVGRPEVAGRHHDAHRGGSEAASDALSSRCNLFLALQAQRPSYGRSPTTFKLA